MDLTLLVLSDLHYFAAARQKAPGGRAFGAHGIELAKFLVGQCGRLLDQRQCPHQLGKGTDGLAGNREILQGAQGVHTPIGMGRDRFLAQQVVLGSRRHEALDVQPLDLFAQLLGIVEPQQFADLHGQLLGV